MFHGCSFIYAATTSPHTSLCRSQASRPTEELYNAIVTTSLTYHRLWAVACHLHTPSHSTGELCNAIVTTHLTNCNLCAIAPAAARLQASRPTEELYNAIVKNDLAAVYEKIEAGADVNFVFGPAYASTEGYTPLMVACHRGRLECAKALLRAGAQAADDCIGVGVAMFARCCRVHAPGGMPQA